MFGQLKNYSPFKMEELSKLKLKKLQTAFFLHQNCNKKTKEELDKDFEIMYKLIVCILLAKGDKVFKEGQEKAIFKKKLSDLIQDENEIQEDSKILNFLRDIAGGMVNVGSQDETLQRAALMLETIQLSSYWPEQVEQSGYTSDELSIKVTESLISKWNCSQFTEKCVYNGEFLRKHVSISIENILEKDENKVKQKEKREKFKSSIEQIVSQAISEDYKEVITLLMKNLMGIQVEKQDLMRALVQSLGGSEIKDIVFTEFLDQNLEIHSYLISVISLLYIFNNTMFKQSNKKGQVIETTTIMGWLRGSSVPNRDMSIWRTPYLLRVKKEVEEIKRESKLKIAKVHPDAEKREGGEDCEEEGPSKKAKEDNADKDAPYTNYNSKQADRQARGGGRGRGEGRGGGRRARGRGFRGFRGRGFSPFYGPHQFGRFFF